MSEEEEQTSLEQNLHPMWASPQALAKLLHTQLSPQVPGGLTLSKCQEALAQLFEFKSWNHLIARFNVLTFPQVLAAEVDLEASENGTGEFPEQPFRCYRTPVHMLAAVYDGALERQRLGQPRPVVSVSWLLGTNLKIQVRDCTRRSIVDELLSTLPAPSRGATPEECAARDTWETRQKQLEIAANQWESVPTWLLRQGSSDECFDLAVQALGRCGEAADVEVGCG